MFIPIRLIKSRNKVRNRKRVSEVEDSDFPIKIRSLGDGTYVLSDGRHRLEAALRNGLEFIDVVVESK